MKKYTVKLIVNAVKTIEVEADGPYEAQGIAWNIVHDRNYVKDHYTEFKLGDMVGDVRAEEKKARITNVKCEYTGGGYWSYSARYGDLWLDGSVNDYIYLYSENPVDEDGYIKGIDPIYNETAPTWAEILASLATKSADVDDKDEAISCLIEANAGYLDCPCDMDC